MKSNAQRYPMVGWRWRALRTYISASRAGNGDCWRGVLAASILGLSAAVHAACPPDAADGTVVRKGDLLLAYRLASGAGRLPMAQHFALEVQLCDKDGVSAARLHKADATMPEHRHGMNYRPAITPLSGGRFRVEGMMLHMAGHWQLSFEVLAGKENLRLSHDVQVD
ncbi:MAG: hypothetical protein Q8S20_08785 [Sulfuritalea sp.]|nr:hypothetical protein [Sulfuritalea sp.]